MTTILIVDDEAPIRELLTKWLNDSTYTTLQAVDAESAVEMMAAGNGVDVVFCDIEMPGKGGLWLVGELRDRFPKTAIILATGVDSVPAAISLRGGVVQYLLKPFTRQGVLTAVADAVRWQKHGQSDSQGSADAVGEWLAEPQNEKPQS